MNEPKKLLLETPGPDFEPHWVYELDESAYHADRTAVSSTSLRAILKSPKTFWSQFVDGIGKEETDAMKFGRLAHMAILEGEKFKERYRVMPRFSGLTKDGRESEQSGEARDKRKAWLADQPPGAVVVTEEERDQLLGMIDSVLAHPVASELLKNGGTEVSGYYVDPKTGVKCRIRTDFLSFDGDTLVDVKTTLDCSIQEFSKQVWNRRWDFQLAMYSAGVEAITKQKPKQEVFIAIEKVPPYEVAVYVADDVLMTIGRVDYRRALDKLHACIQANRWEGYSDGIQNLFLPKYVLDMYEKIGD